MTYFSTRPSTEWTWLVRDYSIAEGSLSFSLAAPISNSKMIHLTRAPSSTNCSVSAAVSRPSHTIINVRCQAVNGMGWCNRGQGSYLHRIYCKYIRPDPHRHVMVHWASYYDPDSHLPCGAMAHTSSFMKLGSQWHYWPFALLAADQRRAKAYTQRVSHTTDNFVVW